MSLKRKLTQDDLRKAMNEHKKKTGSVKRVESPLARYTETGQLMCILCQSNIKNEIVWAIHLNSKGHKDNVALAKKTKLDLENKKKDPTSFKRPASPVISRDSKKVKSILKTTTSPKEQGLPSDFFDKPIQHENTTSVTERTKSIPVADNADAGERTEEPAKNKEAKDLGPPTLPEGFFDDPIMDAKVRNVEYKDPIEEEWERFQKEIKEETAQSAQIIADDQEEATTERQRDEIEEQIRHWSRVMDLVKRKEQVQAADRKQDSGSDDASSEDEAGFDEFLDWRAKNSYQ